MSEDHCRGCDEYIALNHTERDCPGCPSCAEYARFIAEWSERFGHLATKHPRDSIESIDEVARWLEARMTETEGIALGEAERAQNHLKLREEAEARLEAANRALAVEKAKREICEAVIDSLERELDTLRTRIAELEEALRAVVGVLRSVHESAISQTFLKMRAIEAALVHPGVARVMEELHVEQG